MKPFSRLMLLLSLVATLAGCGSRQTPDNLQGADSQGMFAKVRGMTVAGIFYPQSQEKLSEQVTECLDGAKVENIENLRALICPHAGYEYSGKTAGIGYKQLTGRDIRTVIVMGPSHHAVFKGAMIPAFDAYETPLGNVPVSPLAAKLAEQKPFSANPESKVQRPNFWQLAPKELPPFGSDTPDTWEHSVEVQLPFLQKVLDRFEFVPIIFYDADPVEAADTLIGCLDDRTLLVASSDLSHYNPDDIAKTIDAECVKAIRNLTDERIGPEEACGFGPVQTIIEIARRKGWKAKLLDYRNSGDVPPPLGDKRAVVGYAAIAFHDPGVKEAAKQPAEAAGQPEYSPKERQTLLKLARDSVTAAVAGGEPPRLKESELTEKFTARKATFVTLTNATLKKGEDLRGCVGAWFPQEPLYMDVIHHARSAVLDDTRFRFNRVKADELKDIEIEISVLTLPRQLMSKSPQDLLDKLKPGVHGVIFTLGRSQGVFLPQVWEQIPDKKEFLGRLCEEKAGLPPTSWKDPRALVQVYRVEAFKESEK